MKKSFLIRSSSAGSLDRIQLVHDPDLDLLPDKITQDIFRTRWKKLNQDRKLSGKPPLKDCPLFRPGSVRQRSDINIIHCGLTSYMTTSLLASPCTGWHVNTLGAGLSIVPVCSDRRILIGRRSGVVYQGKDLFHVAAGHAHPKTNFQTEPDSLTGAALQELDEEMAIQSSDIIQMDFLGTGLDLTTSKTEFITRVFLNETSDTYIRRWKTTAGLHPCREFDEITTVNTITGKDSIELHEHSFTVACRMALKAHESAETERV